MSSQKKIVFILSFQVFLICNPSSSAPVKPASTMPSLNRPYTHQDLANYVNSVGHTNGGNCLCNNSTYLCNCEIKVDQLGQYQSFQVSSDAAALVVQEMKRSENLIFGNLNKAKTWPPSDPIVISKKFPTLLGSLNAREEPLNHLQLLPEDIKTIGTKFLLYTSTSKDVPVTVGYENSSRLNEAPATCTKMFIITHGFRGSSQDIPMVDLRREILKYNPDACVVMVDWTRGASWNSYSLSSYAQAVANSVVVGRETGLLINRLVEENLTTPCKVHLIGFSLGSHASHFASRWFSELQARNSKSIRRSSTGPSVKVGRITGLDPAARHFQGYNGSFLSRNDADFVDVIHTSGVQNGGDYVDILNSRFGFKDSVGDVDFYPNGGVYQPDCESASMSSGLSEYYGCSHNKAIFYFIDSLQPDVKKEKLISVPCDDYSHLVQCKTLFLGRSLVSSMSRSAASLTGGRLGRVESPKTRGRSLMGMDSDHFPGRGKQYLTYSRA